MRRRSSGIGRANLSDQAIVFGVRPDPEPADAVGHFHTEGTIAQPDAHRAESPDRLELKRRMLRISLQQLVILVCQFTHIRRQSPIRRPEVVRRVVLQSGVVRPAACSASARSASLSRRPLATSASSCRSQCTASKSANQARSCSSSSGERALMARSICSTFPMVWTFSIETFYPRSEEHRLPEAVARWTATTGILPALPLMAANAKSRNGRDHFAIARDEPYSGLPVTRRPLPDLLPTRRRYRQHFLGRDPYPTFPSAQSRHWRPEQEWDEGFRHYFVSRNADIRLTVPGVVASISPVTRFSSIWV